MVRESGIAVRGNDCEIALVIFPSTEAGPLCKITFSPGPAHETHVSPNEVRKMANEVL